MYIMLQYSLSIPTPLRIYQYSLDGSACKNCPLLSPALPDGVSFSGSCNLYMQCIKAPSFCWQNSHHQFPPSSPVTSSRHFAKKIDNWLSTREENCELLVVPTFPSVGWWMSRTIYSYIFLKQLCDSVASWKGTFKEKEKQTYMIIYVIVGCCVFHVYFQKCMFARKYSQESKPTCFAGGTFAKCLL